MMEEAEAEVGVLLFVIISQIDSCKISKETKQSRNRARRIMKTNRIETNDLQLLLLLLGRDYT